MSGWWIGLVLALLGAGTLTVGTPPRHLSVAGATGSLPYLRRAAGDFERSRPNWTVSISGGGSVAGLVEVSRGRIDVGVSDLAPREEWTGGILLKQRPLGRIPLLVIVHRAVGVSQLSAAQSAAVLSGKIANWDQVGGTREPVVVVTRPGASGARVAIVRELLGREKISRRAIVALSNGAELALVRETPGAIGYVESGQKPPGVRVLILGGAHFEPSHPERWPYRVVPTLYWRKDSGAEVAALVRFLATRAYRSAYGLYAGTL